MGEWESVVAEWTVRVPKHVVASSFPGFGCPGLEPTVECLTTSPLLALRYSLSSIAVRLDILLV